MTTQCTTILLTACLSFAASVFSQSAVLTTNEEIKFDRELRIKVSPPCTIEARGSKLTVYPHNIDFATFAKSATWESGMPGYLVRTEPGSTTYNFDLSGPVTFSSDMVLRIIRTTPHVDTAGVLIIHKGSVRPRILESKSDTPTENPKVSLCNEILTSAASEKDHYFDDWFIWLDGGSFGFVLRHERDRITVIFPYPSRWSKERKRSRTPLVMINNKNTLDQAVDITEHPKLLARLSSYFEAAKEVQSPWIYQCARRALKGEMIWTEQGSRIVPPEAEWIVSEDTIQSVRRQKLLNAP